MDTNENAGASSSRTASDVDGELKRLEERRAELEREKAERAKAEQGPADRAEMFISGIVELSIDAARGRPVNVLRERAGKVLEAIRG